MAQAQVVHCSILYKSWVEIYEWGVALPPNLVSFCYIIITLFQKHDKFQISMLLLEWLLWMLHRSRGILLSLVQSVHARWAPSQLPVNFDCSPHLVILFVRISIIRISFVVQINASSLSSVD